jgi:hypothetical protein
MRREPNKFEETPAGETPAGETSAPADGTIDPFRVTVEIAVGPNPNGLDDLARDAHGHAPDPAPTTEG